MTQVMVSFSIHFSYSAVLLEYQTVPNWLHLFCNSFAMDPLQNAARWGTYKLWSTWGEGCTILHQWKCKLPNASEIYLADEFLSFKVAEGKQLCIANDLPQLSVPHVGCDPSKENMSWQGQKQIFGWKKGSIFAI